MILSSGLGLARMRVLTGLIVFFVGGPIVGFAAECPDTINDWIVARDTLLKKFKNAKVPPFKSSVFAKCPVPAELGQCMAPLRTFLSTDDHLKKNSLTAIFEAAAPAGRAELDFPEMTRLPELFRSSDLLDVNVTTGAPGIRLTPFLGRFATQFPNGKWVRFTSNLALELGASTLVFYIPGSNVDRWIHAFASDKADQIQNDFLMVAVQKRDRSGNELTRAHALYSVFETPKASKPSRTPGDSAAVPQAPQPKPVIRVRAPQETCFQCHRTGPMPLVPVPGTRVFTMPGRETPAQVLSFLNNKIGETADASAAIESLQGFGPPMGPAKRATRTDAFIQQCALPVELSNDEIRDVKSAMNCVQCHDGRMAGAITYPLGPLEGIETSGNPRDQKTLEFMIKTGHMPPGKFAAKHDPKSKQFRGAPYRCLMSEYYGEFLGYPGRGIFMESLEPSCPASAGSLPGAVPAPANVRKSAPAR